MEKARDTEDLAGKKERKGLTGDMERSKRHGAENKKIQEKRRMRRECARGRVGECSEPLWWYLQKPASLGRSGGVAGDSTVSSDT